MKLSMVSQAFVLSPRLMGFGKYGTALAALSSRLCLLALILLCSFAQGYAQSTTDVFPPKPEPAVYVNDYANWLTPHERATLELKLRKYWDSTSTQIVVMIRPDLGDYDKSEYATELGQRWGVGQKGKDNGVIILVKTEAPGRGAFIATGYGAEGALPDGLAGEIIRTVMIPFFRTGENYKGLDAGTDAVISVLSGEYQRDVTSTEIPFWVILLIFLSIIFIFWLFSRMARNATMYDHDGKRVRRSVYRHEPPGRGGWIITGGGGFGGGGGGGGFGGGSFGGGGFGGGGAGGDW